MKIYIRPAWWLLSSARNMAAFPGDVVVLNTVTATMPDWYLKWYGRSPARYYNREIFYVSLVQYQLGGLVPIATWMEFLFELTANLFTVVAHRQNGNLNPNWLVEPDARATGLWPDGIGIDLTRELAGLRNMGEN